jgi:hypothetical protein
MSKDMQARQTAQNLANSNNRPVYIHTDDRGEYVLCFVHKSESFECVPLTLVEVVEPK